MARVNRVHVLSYVVLVMVMISAGFAVRDEDPRVGARRRRAVLEPVDCGTQDGVVRGR